MHKIWSSISKVKKHGIAGVFHAGTRFLWRRIVRISYSVVYILTHPNDFFKTPKPLPALVRKKNTRKPPVTILIPFKDNFSILKTCIESIVQKTTYKNYSILLVNNQSAEPETYTYLENLIKTHSHISIYTYDKPFNFADLHNEILDKKVETEHVILLNNDTEVLSPDWIEQLLKEMVDSTVGAVGALLWYPNNTIQHAGVAVGMFSMSPFHIYKGLSKKSKLYKSHIAIRREFHAVTAACMMTKKSLWKKIGGMDGTHFAVALNDVDYCLCLREAGYRIVYTPHAELYHYESYSRGYEFTHKNTRQRLQKEESYFLKKWKKYKHSTEFITPIDYILTLLG
jgi:O-antigen biosynthesis protein